MDILNYVKEVLARQMIGFEIISEGEFGIPCIDELVRSSGLPHEREVVRITLHYGVKFILFRHEKSLGLVGPYRTDFITGADIDEEEAGRIGFEPGQLLSVPAVAELGLFKAMMDTLFDFLWNRDGYSFHDINGTESPNVSIYSDNIEDNNAAEVSRRYRREDAMLQAVKSCNLEYIEGLFAGFSMDKEIEKRNNNPVRNMQNYSIISNTLLRRAAYESGVAAFYVDRLSSIFGRRIEKLSTSRAAGDLIAEMMKEYSLLIRDYSWSGYPEAIKAVLFIIDSRYREHLSLDELGGAAGLSAPYLSRLFTKQVGKTVSEYINEVRITKSLESLKNPDVTIAEAAVASGFEDQSYYTRAFKKVKGITPTEWRSAHLGK